MISELAKLIYEDTIVYKSFKTSEVEIDLDYRTTSIYDVILDDEGISDLNSLNYTGLSEALH